MRVIHNLFTSMFFIISQNSNTLWMLFFSGWVSSKLLVNNLFWHYGYEKV